MLTVCKKLKCSIVWTLKNTNIALSIILPTRQFNYMAAFVKYWWALLKLFWNKQMFFYFWGMLFPYLMVSFTPLKNLKILSCIRRCIFKCIQNHTNLCHYEIHSILKKKYGDISSNLILMYRRCIIKITHALNCCVLIHWDN